jgi:hypothetical protein
MVNKLMKSPILVTGAHRSGTSWVGHILAASPDLAYISEPLNVLHRPGVLREPVQYWYHYICEENQMSILPAFEDTLNFQYHYWLELKSLRSIKDVGRMLRDIGRFSKGRLQGAQPLLKDPFAIFSAPWFASQLGCQVVIAVRHPLAFVSSLKRLDWQFNFRDLLMQPLLMRDYLEPFREDMTAAQKDIISQGSLLWRIIYYVIDQFSTSHPDFVVIRHEDLSRDPERGFRELFDTLGLVFTSGVQNALKNYSQRGNPKELSKNKVHGIKLDSQANLTNWKKRLSAYDISRIRQITLDVADKFYSEDTWE